MQSKLAGSATPATSGRPSLYAGPAVQAGSGQSDSILGGLESAHPRLKKRGAFIATVIVIVLGVAGWLIARSGPGALMAEIPVPLAGAVAIPPAAIAALPVAPPQAKAPAPIIVDADAPDLLPASTVPAAAPAQESPIAKAASQVAHEQSLSDREELLPADASVAQVQPVVVASAITGTSAAADLAGQATRKAAAPPAEMPAMAVMARPVAKVAVPEKSEATAAARPASGGAAKKSGEKDGDVELIAALLNRVSSKTEAAAGEAVRKPDPKHKPDDGRKSTASAAQKKSRKTAGIRESVSPRPADTAQAQLQRCNTLGFFEAEMCRLRTCTGRWGSDPGCPEYAQNSSVAP